MHLIWYIVIIYAAFGGFLVSYYISKKKNKHQKLLCPLKFDCTKVVNSEYSKLFGIPLENLGLLYYGVIALSYSIFFVFPQFVSPIIVYSILILSTFAFLFSIYLTFIQAFTLKEWCTWCLISASLSITIFISAMLTSNIQSPLY